MIKQHFFFMPLLLGTLGSLGAKANCVPNGIVDISTSTIESTFGTTHFVDYNMDLGALFGLSTAPCKGVAVTQVVVHAKSGSQSPGELQLWPNSVLTDRKTVTGEWEDQVLEVGADNIADMTLTYLGLRLQHAVEVDDIQVYFGPQEIQPPPPPPAPVPLGQTGPATFEGASTDLSVGTASGAYSKVKLVARTAEVELTLSQITLIGGETIQEPDTYLDAGQSILIDLGEKKDIQDIYIYVRSAQSGSVAVYGIR